MTGARSPTGDVYPPFNMRGDVNLWHRRRCDPILLREQLDFGRWAPWYARLVVLVELRVGEPPYPRLAVVRSYTRAVVSVRIGPTVRGRAPARPRIVRRTGTECALRAVDISVIDGPARLLPFFQGTKSNRFKTAGEFALVLPGSVEEGGMCECDDSADVESRADDSSLAAAAAGSG